MLAILDWGIGEIGYYRRFRAAHPQAPVIYWSDAGFTPYGKLSGSALAVRVAGIFDALQRLGATRCVVACNAASTVLPEIVAPFPVTGIIRHGVRAALNAGGRRIGVVGGVRTIRSGVYRRALAAQGRTVTQRIAQPLSARVEAGELNAPRTLASLQTLVAPLRSCDAVLLACTHYPALRPHFQSALPDVRLLDPVDELHRWVEKNGFFTNSRGRQRFFATGDPAAMQRAAWRAFALKIALPHSAL